MPVFTVLVNSIEGLITHITEVQAGAELYVDKHIETSDKNNCQIGWF